MQEVTILNEGLSTVFAYDNIAIVVLMVVVVLQALMIWALLRKIFKITDKMAEVLVNLREALTVLNERIKHYDDEHNTKRDS